MLQKERVVYQNDGFISIMPFAPRTPFEMWILPKRHASSFYCQSDSDLYGLAMPYLAVATGTEPEKLPYTGNRIMRIASPNIWAIPSRRFFQ